MDATDLHLDVTMRRVLPTIAEIFKQYGPDGFKLEYTAGKEWFHHSFWSLHHSGNAVDVRTKTLPDHGVGVISLLIAHHLQTRLNKRFGKGKYTVLYNDQGPSAPHLHVQFNKGGRFSSPGDFPQSSLKYA